MEVLLTQQTPLFVAKEANMKKVTKKSNPVELSGKRCYVGVDVHKASYYVSILAEDGARREFSTKADPDSLVFTLCEKLGITVMALAHESGPTGYALAWACQDAGIPIVVAASSRIPRPITAAGKTDRLDCIKLADYLAKGMLQSIAIPSREDFAFRELSRKSRSLTRSRSRLKQEIKSFLLKNAIKEPEGLLRWTKSALAALREIPLPKTLRATLDLHLDQLEYFSSQIRRAKALLKEAAEERGQRSVLDNLQTIPGVGEVISYTFAAEVFTPERFASAGQVCSFTGLAPQVRHSGEGKARARLRSVGQKQLRTALVEGAWIWMRSEPTARALFNRIVSKTGLPQKAICAVARKLVVVLWRIAVENRPYRLSTAT